jgi:hypothetical protein
MYLKTCLNDETMKHKFGEGFQFKNITGKAGREGGMGYCGREWEHEQG